ncbi:tetratricopeptide repeat protein [Novosphingobium sp. AAP83]|uniref:O-linked N-acetylglucosamine transferase, SPINDLY family protein n=1 Tax=Novosphingobium sp. AAP83 TaxID=1523425 RepID=UPI0009EA644D|nr:tetratricopeptide repeat protein [Novosphingobium sp. AAP83]
MSNSKLIKKAIQLHKSGKVQDSIGIYLKILPKMKLNSDFLCLIGSAYYEIGEALKAYQFLKRSVLLNPENPESQNNLGNVLKKLNRLDEAINHYDKAISLEAKYATAYYNRGITLQKLKRLDEAYESYKYAFDIDPKIEFLLGIKLHLQMHLSNWLDFENQLESIKKKIDENNKAIYPFDLLSLIDCPATQKMASQIYVKAKFDVRAVENQKFKINKSHRIKIGYFSADFHNHATMHLLADVLEKHDKDHFEIFAFSFGPITNDAWQSRARKAFDQFIECNNNSDKEIAKLSRDLGIEIAIDLKGFTTDSRTGIFADRAAPIQVNFLGYPGTMGTDFIDYIVADKLLIKEEQQEFYVEKIAYLPDCYQPNCYRRDVFAESVCRSNFSLPKHGVVFSSFNNNYKITPPIFASWMRILKEVDGSVLWLLATNSIAQNNLKKYAFEANIDVNRLIFAENVPIQDHLNRIRLADIFLDTFPCGAHTTCSDALRMGLPVVTMEGQSFASRVAASLLTNAGIPELIAKDLQSYEKIAIELALDSNRIKKIRGQLLDNNHVTSLFDPKIYAKNIEILYRKMHHFHLNELPPGHIYVQ